MDCVAGKSPVFIIGFLDFVLVIFLAKIAPKLNIILYLIYKIKSNYLNEVSNYHQN